MAVQTMSIATQERPPSALQVAKPPSNAVIGSLAADEQVLLTKLLTEPTDYMDHPEFAKRGIERKLFGGEAKLAKRMSTRFVELPDAVTDSVIAGERVPALAVEQEQHLFKRFN